MAKGQRPINAFTSEFARAIRPATPNKKKIPDVLLKEFRDVIYTKTGSQFDAVIGKMFDLAHQTTKLSELMDFVKYIVPGIKEKSCPLSKKIKSSTAEEIAEAQSLILEDMGEGTIEREYGMELMKALTMKRDSIIVQELEKRVNAIQGKTSSVKGAA